MILQNNKEIATEICTILDSLAVLASDLPCESPEPPDRLILPATRIKEVCTAIEQAVPTLKRLLELVETDGKGRLPLNDEAAD